MCSFPISDIENVQEEWMRKMILILTVKSNTNIIHSLYTAFTLSNISSHYEVVRVSYSLIIQS